MGKDKSPKKSKAEVKTVQVKSSKAELKKTVKEKATPAKAKPPPPPKESSDESSEESSEDEKPAKPAVAAPKGAISKPKPVALPSPDSDDSDSDSSSSEDSDVKVKPTKNGASKTGKAAIAKPTPSKSKPDSDSDSSDSSDSSDDELTATTKTAAVAAPKGAPSKRKAEDDVAVSAKKAKVAANEESSEEIKTLFVGQLSYNVDNDWLATEFTDAGEVVSARVQMDRQSGRSRGFGYVEFATAEAAQTALEKFQGKEIDGRPVKLDLSAPRQPNPAARAKAFGDVPNEPSSTLFVGNLSWTTTEDMVWEHFGQFGEVSSVRLPTDRESGQPKGFGYVEFADVGSATKGYEGAAGSSIDGRPIRLDYSKPRDPNGGGGGGGGGGRGGGRGFDRGGGGRGGGRGRGGDRGRGGRGGGRGAPRGGARTGGIAAFEGKKMTF
ncbi:hypothetical protein BU17DRAFT_51208 [Hysterangium stoloniferum]|nr:hypothetical protein BU17DRAFT_51208 [Hysterangium stoloniferum]